MHATTRNLVTCAWPGCPQPEAMTVKHPIPTETVVLADGKRYLLRPATVVEIGYCAFHGGEQE
jgi:hypothetical protein